MNQIPIHPATLLWWEQRDKCRACAHHHAVELSSRKNFGPGSGGERCTASKYAHVKLQGTEHMYCIDARLDGGPCGPEAKLFKEKDE